MKRALIVAALALAVLSAPVGQASVHAGGVGIGFGIGFSCNSWCKPACPQCPPPPPCCVPMGYGYPMPPAPCYNCGNPYGLSAYPGAGAADPAAAAAAAAMAASGF